MIAHRVGRVSIVLLLIVLIFVARAYADIKNWQTGETIAGTEGIVPGPGVDLWEWNSAERNLQFADFGGMDLSGALLGSLGSLTFDNISPRGLNEE